MFLKHTDSGIAAQNIDFESSLENYIFLLGSFYKAISFVWKLARSLFNSLNVKTFETPRSYLVPL